MHVRAAAFAQDVFDARAAYFCRDRLRRQGQGRQYPREVARGSLMLLFSLQDVRLERGEVQSREL